MADRLEFGVLLSDVDAAVAGEEPQLRRAGLRGQAFGEALSLGGRRRKLPKAVLAAGLLAFCCLAAVMQRGGGGAGSGAAPVAAEAEIVGLRGAEPTREPAPKQGNSSEAAREVESAREPAPHQGNSSEAARGVEPAREPAPDQGNGSNAAHAVEPARGPAPKQGNGSEAGHAMELTEQPAPKRGTDLEAATKEVEQEKKVQGVALGASCLKNHDCRDAGHQCFTKNAWWAQCLVDCTPGPNPVDQESPSPWECQVLGNRTAGKPKLCSGEGENCIHSSCCRKGGTQCFAKDDTFAMCKPSCEPGPQVEAPDWDDWSCEPLGEKAVGAANWVADQCTQSGKDCSQTHCCATPGDQCYLLNQFWGACKPGCTEGQIDYDGAEPWQCTPVGCRTPSFNDVEVPKGLVAAWVPKHCSAIYEDCSKTHCCQAVNHQCFRRDTYWATCRESCSTDPDPNDGNKTWSCETRGPRSWGLALRGYPSLFCISLYMPSRYEGPLLRSHLKANAGIFSCDGYEVFAAENDTLGNSSDGILVRAVLIQRIDVGVSQDGTAGNAKLFMAVWDKVIAGGRFNNYDWTIKVDPDAVIIPWRVRSHMAQHTGEDIYVVNCNKFPGTPNFPMMFGALEVFSRGAMYAYAGGSWRCGQQLPWGGWGEDFYMTHCLDFLGVRRLEDFMVLGDNMCSGANCGDGGTASFHPFKDEGSWFRCWAQATR